MTKQLRYLYLCSGILAGLLLPALWTAVQAATPLTSLSYSPDIDIELNSTLVADQGVLEDDLSGLTSLLNLGALPAGADIDAYHNLGDGEHLLSFDVTVDLGGLTIDPADVVRYDGFTYTLEFDASAAGVPDGANVDAVAFRTDNDLYLSFDTTVTLQSVVYHDEDIVSYDGANFNMVLKTAAEGIPAQLDVDAIDRFPNVNGSSFLLSFDGSGTVNLIDFDDEDVLEFGPGGWEMAYDASAADTNWRPADMDALSIETPTITGIWPGDAPNGTFVSLFVFGSGYDQAFTSVFMNGNQQAIVQVVSPDMLIVRAQVNPGLTGPVRVTAQHGQATSPTQFGVPLTGLQITGIWPGTVTENVPASVFIFGSEFDPAPGATEVYFNGIRQFIVQVVSPDMLIVRITPTAAMAGPVTVTTPAGTVTSSTSLVVVP